MNPMRGSAASAGLSAIILRAWGQVPSITSSVLGGTANVSGETAPGPGNKRAVPGWTRSSSIRGWPPNPMPSCNSLCRSPSWAIRAVPMATRDSRGCWRKTTRVAVSTGTSPTHQQADAGRWHREQVGRGPFRGMRSSGIRALGQSPAATETARTRNRCHAGDGWRLRTGTVFQIPQQRQHLPSLDQARFRRLGSRLEARFPKASADAGGWP
jgi:hypothetical protein